MLSRINLGLLCCDVVGTHVSEDHYTSFFRVKLLAGLYV
jgi:hypothetical protein